MFRAGQSMTPTSIWSLSVSIWRDTSPDFHAKEFACMEDGFTVIREMRKKNNWPIAITAWWREIGTKRQMAVVNLSLLVFWEDFFEETTFPPLPWGGGPTSRRCLGCDDAAADAALLSQVVGRPVRVQWMRHDEHGWEPMSPSMTMDVRAGLDAQSHITAFDFQRWSQSHSRGSVAHVLGAGRYGSVHSAHRRIRNSRRGRRWHGPLSHV